MVQLETGDTGRAVTADSDGALYSGIFGLENYVVYTGNKFKAEIQSNNKIKINDGSAIMNGRHIRIPSGDSELVTINNGSQGKNRIDIIVFRYKKELTGMESANLVVIQGEETTSVAKTPNHIKGSILTGAVQADFPLYSVELKGINIVEITPLFNVLMDMSALNEKLYNIKDHIVESGKIKVSGDIYNYYEKYASGKLVQWGIANYSYTSGYGKIDYPIPFVGGTEDYTLFVQGRYIPSKIVEIMVAAKQSTSYGYAYALLANNTRPDSHNFDWYAIGRWK